MSRSGRDLDEDDVRVRPGRRKSRPRSKDRPSFDQALPGTVITVDRGRFTVAMDDGTESLAVKAREIGRKGVVVGDRVGLVTDTRPGTESLSRIVRVDTRSTVLRRTADDDDPVERVIVANADQLAVVVATVDPEPRLGFIDRAFVAAIDAGRFADEITPILIPSRKGEPVSFASDEQPRAGTTAESLGKLKPAFKKDGTVTAANASGLNDGAAALVVMSRAEAEKRGSPVLATIRSWATAGVGLDARGRGGAQKPLRHPGMHLLECLLEAAG